MNELNLLMNEVFPVRYPVVFFHAHPDDESFLSAGLLNELVTRGRKCVVVFAAAAIVDGQEQTLIRQKEAANACHILGVDLILYLDFCEPKFLKKPALPLVCQKISVVSNNLLTTLNKNNIQNPFILMSYDKNGGYGNKDHKIIHAVGRYFQIKHKNLVASLYEVTLNRDKTLEWLSGAKKRLAPQSMPKLSYWSAKFGLASEEIAYQYELTEKQLKLKCEALTMYKSQISPGEFPLSLTTQDFMEVFGCEFLKQYN